MKGLEVFYSFQTILDLINLVFDNTMNTHVGFLAMHVKMVGTGELMKQMMGSGW